MKSSAPWTPEQVSSLERRQANEMMHPYTCPGGKLCGESRDLVPTEDGLVCPCGRYAQTWALRTDTETT